MVLDASAVVAILLEEAEAPGLASKITKTPRVCIGAPTLLECAIVLGRRFGDDALFQLERFLFGNRVEVVPFAPEHWHVAWRAHWRFGKGRHPAALNFGDCMSYAVAKVGRLPLLFVGGDFRLTDVEAAL